MCLFSHFNFFAGFFGTKPCGDHLNVYGAPIRYHVKLHTMGRTDKFDEHALPRFYVGPSPENPEEKYVWTGSRHISVGGSFVIDETRYLAPLSLTTEYFHSWPVPIPFTIICQTPSNADHAVIWRLKPNGDPQANHQRV